MWSALLQRTQSSYPLAVVLLTRLVATCGGLLTIVYIMMTGALPLDVLPKFWGIGGIAVLNATLITLLHSLATSRHLRAALDLLFQGQKPSPELGEQALLEARRFNLVHHQGAMWLVPLVSTIPVLVVFRVAYGLPWFNLLNVFAGAQMGIALSLLMTYFVTESAMTPMLRLLRQHELTASIDTPVERLHYRVILCFTVIIACAVTMIGAVSICRVQEIMEGLPSGKFSIGVLEFKLLSISVASLAVGFFFSRLLAASVTSRVSELVVAMNAVQSGNFGTRIDPQGNDEIELLGHRFNVMVSDLEMLHTQLEGKVASRTQELQASLTKLQELDRLKTEFFSNVSHELRTPLMMILSPIRQVQNALEASIDARSKSLLDVAHNNGHRLLKQINQLLEFSKIEAGRAKVVEGPVDLNEIARRLSFAALPLAEQRGVKLEIDLDASIPVTSSDDDKLDTILTNLLSNAIKFTPSGGRIRIVSRLVKCPHRGTQRLRMSVEDTGKGIAEKDFPRLFQRFVQLDGSTSREYSGTGLGLALVRELIELLGGTVGVTSELGVGTTFQIELPYQSPSEEVLVLESPSGLIRQESFAELNLCRIETSRSHLPAVSLSAQTILVVDDNPQIRDLLVGLLSVEYLVVTAENGLQALEELERQIPDLIISDVMMPHIDGQELCRRVKARRDTAQVPFILLTARSKTSMKIEGLDCGAEDYVCKPFEDAELLARVRALLRVRRATVQLDQRNTELQNTNDALKHTQKQLVQAEKLSSLGQLVAGLAHEINNSINAVYNGIPALKLRLQKMRRSLAIGVGAGGKLSLAPELETSFDKLDLLANVIADGAERTARIVSDMKTFAHPGRDRDEDFDLHRALDLCLNLSAKQSASTIRIEKAYGEVPIIHGPYGQLHQVFLNLMSNSVQAMGNGGRLHVQTEAADGDMIIRIRDTGSGIPEMIRNRIFEPFFTTKAPGVGTGLGLSISYGIVNKLGGTIECESELNQGTEFTLRIPLPAERVKDEALATHARASR